MLVEDGYISAIDTADAPLPASSDIIDAQGKLLPTPMAMLAVPLALAARGLRTLPEAINLVTRNPARAVGLNDLGALIAGYRADLILVDDRGAVPRVDQIVVAGTPRLRRNR